jgi:hypothetical protein
MGSWKNPRDGLLVQGVLKGGGVTVERVGISEASLIAGIPKRTLQAFAAAGGIPGAGKPAGRWTFDVEELRRWARKVNRKAPCPISTSAVKRGGRVSRSAASNIDEAYERLFGQTRNAA